MDLSKINKVGPRVNSQEYLPMKDLEDLVLYKDYKITKVCRITTKFGIRITVDVEDSFSVFLSARMAKRLNDDDELLQEMMEACEENRLQMRYLGGEYNQIEFSTQFTKGVIIDYTFPL